MNTCSTSSSSSSEKHHRRFSSSSSSSSDKKKKHHHKKRRSRNLPFSRAQKPYDYRLNLEEDTKSNIFYRHVVFTVPGQMQLVFMSLRKGEFIENETHSGTQFIRVESGEGEIIVNGESKNLTDNTSIMIAPYVSHFVHNTSDKELKLYSLYAPPEHAEHHLDRKQPIKLSK